MGHAGCRLPGSKRHLSPISEEGPTLHPTQAMKGINEAIYILSGYPPNLLAMLSKVLGLHVLEACSVILPRVVGCSSQGGDLFKWSLT